MNIDRRLDCYQILFGRGEEDLLQKEVTAMEENSEWAPDIPSAGIELTSVDGPIFAKEAADKYHLNYELTLDTVEPGRMSLIMASKHGYDLLRDTARSSLCETAKLFGSALGRMGPHLLAETLNNGLSVARGNTLLLMRYGKASALHSNADGGYYRMPISRLLTISQEAIKDRFGTGDFIEGFNSHGYTSAMWELPDAQERLLEVYNDALKGAKSLYPVNFIPAIRFNSSDTASSCACLTPGFLIPRNDIFLRFTDGVRVKHTKRGSDDPMDVFTKGAYDMFAKFEETAEVISSLVDITVYNGCNAIVSICKKLGIAKKYGEAARAEMEMISGGNPVTAHDLYLSMTEVVAEAIRCGTSETTIHTLEEALAKVPHVDWSEHDVGGTVAWKD